MRGGGNVTVNPRLIDGRMRRREFMLQYLGNSVLALGGSLFGASIAYEVYRRRAEAGLAGLRRGDLSGLRPPQQSGSAASKSGDNGAAGGAPSAAGPAPAAAASGSEPATFRAATPAVQRADVTPGMLPVRMRIPSIGLADAKVVEVGTVMEDGELVWGTPDRAVGHYMGTAAPGQTGNMALGGHISSPVRHEGNIFRSLPNLSNQIGSRVSIQNRDGVWHHYEITGTDVVLPSDTWVLDAGSTPITTLITCVPDGVYTHRFVAVGKYIGHD
jgi:LPXTG-site transpeptidase (sortase) family protein